MTEHIVRSYESELGRLNDLMARIAGLAETQLAGAMDAIVRRDAELADRIVADDLQLDQIEREIQALTVRLLALRQPMGIDLRVIVSAPRIASDLERVGDLAKNLAKRTPLMSQFPTPQSIRGFERMGKLVLKQLKAVLDALASHDVTAAQAVWSGDEEIDDMQSSLFRELLTYMMEDPRTITICTHLMFIAKNLERIGDHCTNIAETVYYMKTGEVLAGQRPKGDSTIH